MMKVLVVDDSISACRSISRILLDQATTYCCISAQDWEQHYRAEKPDIILLDIMMPGVNGVDVLKQIREIDKDTPVVMVSAIADRDQVVNCIKLGADGYIFKPISSEKIIQSVQNAGRISALKNIIANAAAALAELKRGITGVR